MESIQIPNDCDYIMEIKMTDVKTGKMYAKNLFHIEDDTIIEEGDLKVLKSINIHKNVIKDTILKINKKNRPKHPSYLCECSKCGRLFYYTFKFNIDKLIVNNKGYIDWKCCGCEKEVKY